MRLDLVPESLPERAALALGAVPRPFAHTHPALILARALMVATKRGVFEVLREGTLEAAEVAARCDADAGAMRALLDALVGADYLRADGDGRYALTKLAERWLLKDAPRSLYHSLLFRYQEWEWLTHLDAFVGSGEPLHIHDRMEPETWGLYQRGMRDFARLVIPEMVRRTPMPPRPQRLLDVGGAHGAFACALCAHHPTLDADVLDLPEAIRHAAPLLAEEAEAAGVTGRVRHVAGDALTDDLGLAEYDVVLLCQVAHHFSDATNRALVARLARALKPGGVLVIQEVIGAEEPGQQGQLAGLAGLYFALTSETGALSFAQMAAWQEAAGLTPRRPLRFRTVPGIGQQNAVKPA